MAKLTAAKRNKLPGSTFAGPDRSYPINDMSHARNALARASGNASSELKAQVRAAVHKKFPGIKMHDEGVRQRKASGGRIGRDDGGEVEQLPGFSGYSPTLVTDDKGFQYHPKFNLLGSGSADSPEDATAPGQSGYSNQYPRGTKQYVNEQGQVKNLRSHGGPVRHRMDKAPRH